MAESIQSNKPGKASIAKVFRFIRRSTPARINVRLFKSGMDVIHVQD